MIGVSDNFIDCPPRANAMIHSLRAIGYDLGMAIADLIDNSIFADAKNITVDYCWNFGNPWVRITDDGCGMAEHMLNEAMRLGSSNPLDPRLPTDLGRFGLGLKTASFSQCRKFSVKTKTADGLYAERFWDLDLIENSWCLGKFIDKESKHLFDDLEKQKSGTIVLWQKIDRMVDETSTQYHDPETAFLKKFVVVKRYLEMVFHKFIQRQFGKGLNIKVGVADCNPWDPFLKKNSFTQELSEERYEDGKVCITPYILPHVSHRSEEENALGAGPKGWNAQQGFYLYRNGRMIVSGGYLDLPFQEEEHYKLVRIAVEINNDMDQEWAIDVKKGSAVPPGRLRGDLERIARAARKRAAEVYRARTGLIRNRPGTRFSDDVWLKKEINNKITYVLNPSNCLLRKVLEEVDHPKNWENKLFHIIETTVPHRLIIMDGLEHEDCHVAFPEEKQPPDGMLELCREFYEIFRSQGRSHSESVDIVCSMEVFNFHPLYRAYLDDKGE